MAKAVRCPVCDGTGLIHHSHPEYPESDACPRCLGFCWVPHPAYYSDDMQWYSAAEVDRLRDAANATAAVFMHVRQDEFVILYPDGGISVEDGMNCRVVGGTVSEVLAHLRSRDEKGT